MSHNIAKNDLPGSATLPKQSITRRKLLKVGASVFFISTFAELSGCGGDSSSGSNSFSSNISGVWTGIAIFFGVSTTVTVTTNQPVSGRSSTTNSGLLSAQAITGTISLNGGTALNATGSKDDNGWSLSGAQGDTVVTLNQTLNSATTTTGTMTLQVGSPSNQATVGLNLTKSS